MLSLSSFSFRRRAGHEFLLEKDLLMFVFQTRPAVEVTVEPVYRHESAAFEIVATASSGEETGSFCSPCNYGTIEIEKIFDHAQEALTEARNLLDMIEKRMGIKVRFIQPTGEPWDLLPEIKKLRSKQMTTA